MISTTHKKVEARVFAKGVLAGSRHECLTELQKRGLLFDDPGVNLRIGFVPWLYKAIAEQGLLEERIADLNKKLLEGVVDGLLEQHAQAIHRENLRIAQKVFEIKLAEQMNENRKSQKRERKRKLLIHKRRSQLEEALFHPRLSPRSNTRPPSIRLTLATVCTHSGPVAPSCFSRVG